MVSFILRRVEIDESEVNEDKKSRYRSTLRVIVQEARARDNGRAGCRVALINLVATTLGFGPRHTRPSTTVLDDTTDWRDTISALIWLLTSFWREGDVIMLDLRVSAAWWRHQGTREELR